MRKQIVVLLAMIFVGLMFVITNESAALCTSEEEMLQTIAREMDLEERAQATMTVTKSIISDDGKELLLLCHLGEHYRPRYYAWTFHIIDDENYKLKKAELITDTNVADTAHLTWDDKYIIVVNNSDIKEYSAVVDGVSQNGIITTMPDVLIFPEVEVSVSFFDSNYMEIR